MSKKVRVVFNPDCYLTDAVFDGDVWYVEDGDVHIEESSTDERVGTVSRGLWAYVDIVHPAEVVAND